MNVLEMAMAVFVGNLLSLMVAVAVVSVLDS